MFLSGEDLVYGGRRGVRDDGREEIGRRSGVMAAAVFAKDIAVALLTSKKTYRVTLGALYSILFVWLLLNIAQMTGNIGRIAEPDDFWKHTRKLVKKSVNLRETHCCCPTTVAPEMGSGQGREDEFLLPNSTTDSLEETVANVAVSRGGGGGEEGERNKGGSDSHSARTHTPSSVPLHSTEDEGGKEGGGDVYEQNVGGEKAVGGGGGGGGGK